MKRIKENIGMLTLYHAPMSRSTRIVALIEELGAQDDVAIEIVSIRRQQGDHQPDPRNPHPDKKVPLLVHDGVPIWESTAIALYLTELYPDAGLGRPVGTPERGQMLSWLAWSGGVFEPVLINHVAELEHPLLQSTFRGFPEAMARLSSALHNGPYLLGDRYSIADLICVSPFTYLSHLVPDDPAFQGWIKRCTERPAQANALAFDTANAPA